MAGVNTNDPKDAPVETTQYRVIVTKVQHNVKFRDKSYEDLGTVKEDKFGKEEREYGYVYSDGYKTETTEVYDQTVDELDLTKVIKAVNGMEN